jgi:glucose/arabinose dehydrogenase
MRYPFSNGFSKATKAILAAALALAAAASAQINFKNAFPGVTFKSPVFFGEVPGMAATTYVVLEQHEGLATLVFKKDNAWTKQTLVKLDVNQTNEMGFLGIAFHPDFKNNHKYYVSYDTPAGDFDMVDERIADATNMKDSAKGRTIFKIADKYENHNGGTIAFGPKDGFLYMGTGDGGSQYDPFGNGQNTNVFLAKMLRIDVDGKAATGKVYAYPADNPFVNGGGIPEIFAFGFRNPWKWSFDPLNGDLWVGDVGQDNVEEVDIVTKGGNYGWSSMEGPNGNNNGSMSVPVFSYDHGTGQAVIGGVVYRGNPASKYYGTYFTADNGSKAFWNLKKNGTAKATSTSLGSTATQVSSFGTDATGLIYACGLYTGIIYQLDSPDLGPAASGIAGQPFTERAVASHPFAASRGSRLQPEAFGNSSKVTLFDMDGAAIASVGKETPMLPSSVRAGVYLLKPDQGGTRLLLVK